MNLVSFCQKLRLIKHLWPCYVSVPYTLISINVVLPLPYTGKFVQSHVMSCYAYCMVFILLPGVSYDGDDLTYLMILADLYGPQFCTNVCG